MSVFEIATVIFSVLYVVLAGYQKPLCWPMGIIASVLGTIYSYQQTYYQDALLQVYYIGVGFYGWYLWVRKKDNIEEVKLSSKSGMDLLPILLGGMVAFPVFGYLFSMLGNAYSYIDSFTTVFSLIATWMVARKILETWLLWVIVDAILAYQFAIKGGYVIAGLYAFYSLISIWNYYNWRKDYLAQMETA